MLHMTFMQIDIRYRMALLRMSYSMTLTYTFKAKLFNWPCLQVSFGKMQTLLLPSDMKLGICHRMVPLRMFYIMTFTYIFKVTKFETWISWRWWEVANNAQVWLYRGWYLPSNGTVVSVVLRDLDLHVRRSNIFLLCDHYKKDRWGSRCPPADLPRLTRPPP